MANLSFADLQSSLVFNLGQRDDIDSYKGNWINTAYIDLCTRNHFWGLKIPQDILFPELDAIDSDKATTAHSAVVSAPVQTLYIKHIWDSTNDRKLTKIAAREYIEKVGRANADSEGPPTYWTRGISGTNIYLSPTPDDTYDLVIYYRQRPLKMSASTDTTVLDESWDEVLLRLATAQSAMRLKDTDRISLWKQEFTEGMADKINWVLKEEKDTKHFLRPDYAYLRGHEYR